MRIGIDIDNVITAFDEKIIVEMFKEDKRKRNSGIVDPNGNWVRHCFDWSDEEYHEWTAENMETFAKHFKPREGAVEFINGLLREGHSVYLISHRVYPDYKTPFETTTYWLKKYNINYTKLIISKTFDKTQECRENNIDIFFDDNPRNCRALIKGGIEAFLIQTNYHQNELKGLNVVRNWQEMHEIILAHARQNVIIDTDLVNEVDDIFALTYALKSIDEFNIEAITIAPFTHSYEKNIAKNNRASVQMAEKVLECCGFEELKNKIVIGQNSYLGDAKKPSEAANKIIEIAQKNSHTTIIAMGALTNIAVALSAAPEIAKKLKIIWLGGNTMEYGSNLEYNFRQDIPAVKKVFESKVALFVIPCKFVASHMILTEAELNFHLKSDNKINKLLKEVFVRGKQTDILRHGSVDFGYSKVIWDLCTIALAINADLFELKYCKRPTIDEDGHYSKAGNLNITFATSIDRDRIFADFFKKLGCEEH